jgi:hypothetical protein
VRLNYDISPAIKLEAPVYTTISNSWIPRYLDAASSLKVIALYMARPMSERITNICVVAVPAIQRQGLFFLLLDEDSILWGSTVTSMGSSLSRHHFVGRHRFAVIPVIFHNLVKVYDDFLGGTRGQIGNRCVSAYIVWILFAVQLLGRCCSGLVASGLGGDNPHPTWRGPGGTCEQASLPGKKLPIPSEYLSVSPSINNVRRAVRLKRRTNDLRYDFLSKYGWPFLGRSDADGLSTGPWAPHEAKE